MPAEIDRKYLVILAVSAAGLLTFGALLRPPAAPRPVPSEAAAIQQSVPRGPDIRDLGRNLGQVASRLGNYVLRLPDSGWTAVRSGDGSTAVAVVPEHGVRSVPVQTGPVPQTRPGELNAGEWLIVVGRTRRDGLAWTGAMFGGSSEAECGSEAVPELTVGNSLPDVFTGGAAFDYDGRLVGRVLQCNGRQVIVPVASIQRLLAPGASDLGFVATPLTPEEQKYFSAPVGFVVHKVETDSIAGRAGLEPGDVLIAPAADADGKLEVRRGGRRLALPLRTAAEDALRGLRLNGGVVEHVEARSVAARAGLRRGDRLVSATAAGGRRVSPAVALRSAGPVFVVYERAGVRTGVFLP